MERYILANNQGSYIALHGNKYVPTKSIRDAKIWDTVQEASNILVNSLSKKIRNGFRVKPINSNTVISCQNSFEEDNSSNPKEICSRKIETCDIDGWIAKIENLSELFKDCENKFEEMSQKQSDIDKEIVDIEHYIEFGTFNAYQGWLCFKILQNLLLQRRQIKNEISILQYVRECRLTEQNIHLLKKSIAGLKTRVYAPRMLPELFAQIKNS